jgi:hypothetical protein
MNRNQLIMILEQTDDEKNKNLFEPKDLTQEFAWPCCICENSKTPMSPSCICHQCVYY